MKEIDKIKQRCKILNVNIYELLRETKIPTSTVFNWNKTNPKPFETLNKINAKLDEIQRETEATSKD